jgi:urease accessory protein
MSWHAQLQLHYQHNVQSDGSGRTTAHHLHEGPLRILQSLYPEGDRICHNVLVHPPGGLVGGDTLSIEVQVDTGAHGLVTTPGATRFYRSEGALALQTTSIQLAADARLEWLPLEALCYSGCKAENKLVMELAPSSELMGWDVTALGLPNAGLPFVLGDFLQHIELKHQWLERGRMAADDERLMDGPLGLVGHRCIASIFFVAGSPFTRARKEMALEAARDVASNHTLATTVGVTSPNPHVIVARVLSPVVEPAMALLRLIREAWRKELWNLRSEHAPRIWST